MLWCRKPVENFQKLVQIIARRAARPTSVTYMFDMQCNDSLWLSRITLLVRNGLRHYMLKPKMTTVWNRSNQLKTSTNLNRWKKLQLTCNWSVVKTVPSKRVTWQERRLREGFLFACCLGEAAGLSAFSPVVPAIDSCWNSLNYDPKIQLIYA